MPDYTTVCNTFYNFYAEQPSQSYRSATIALYGTAQLSALADILKSIYDIHRVDIGQFSPDNLQLYANKRPFYDLDEFVLQLAPSEYDLFNPTCQIYPIKKQKFAQNQA